MPLETQTDVDLFDGLVSRRRAASAAAEPSRPPAFGGARDLGGTPHLVNVNRGHAGHRTLTPTPMFPTSDSSPDDDDDESDDAVTVMVPAAQFQDVRNYGQGRDDLTVIKHPGSGGPAAQHHGPRRGSLSGLLPSFEVELEVDDEEIEPDEITTIGTMPPPASRSEPARKLQPFRKTEAGLGAYVSAGAGPANKRLPSFDEPPAMHEHAWAPATAVPPARTGGTLSGPPGPFVPTREPQAPMHMVLASPPQGVPAAPRVPTPPPFQSAMPMTHPPAPPPLQPLMATRPFPPVAPATASPAPSSLSALVPSRAIGVPPVGPAGTSPPPPPPAGMAGPPAVAPYAPPGAAFHGATTAMLPPPPVGRPNVQAIPVPPPDGRYHTPAARAQTHTDRTVPSTTPFVVTSRGMGTTDEVAWRAKAKGRRTWTTVMAAAVLLGGAGFIGVNAKGALFGAQVEATLKATAKQPGVRLYLDGKEVGMLPLAIKNITPGEHSLEFSIDDHYSTERQRVSVGPNEIRELAPVSLKVVRGIATFDVRSEGASLTLVAGDERRAINDLSRPIEIDTARPTVIEVSKPGFQTMREPLTFDESAHKVFVVELGPKDSSGIARAAERAAAMADTASALGAASSLSAARTANPKVEHAVRQETATRVDSLPKAPPAPRAEPVARAETHSGTCTVNFNSLPPSNVAVDGRPVGPTPKMGVSLPAGTHNVMFAGPEETKHASFTCTAGSQKTVTVRMSQPQ